jgi:hypothetical protein
VWGLQVLQGLQDLLAQAWLAWTGRPAAAAAVVVAAASACLAAQAGGWNNQSLLVPLGGWGSWGGSRGQAQKGWESLCAGEPGALRCVVTLHSAPSAQTVPDALHTSPPERRIAEA